MVDEYPVERIGDVCYVTDGAHAKVDRQPSGVLYLTSKNIGSGQLLLGDVDYITEKDYKRLFSNSAKSQRCLSPGDVLVGIIGTFGNAYLYKKEDYFGVSSAVALLRPDKSRLEPRFLYYVVTSPAFRDIHNAYKAGSVQGYTNIPTIKELPVPIPPLPDQRAIAHILGTLDDKIELNRRMNETLEAMARALFKSWFVDFDPVRAKSQGRDPGLPKPLADLFPASFEDSELGEIPKGWEVKRFSETVDVIGGGTPKTSAPEYWNGNIPWFSVVDAPTESEVWVLDTEKKITQAGVENSSARVLPVGTTILSARGTVGRTGLVAVPMAINQSCYGLQGKDGSKGYFTYYATRQLVSLLKQHAHGSVFNTITRDTLAGVGFVVPSTRLVDAFEASISPALMRMRTSLLESHTLIAQRDTLLPKLISGELPIPKSITKVKGHT